MTEDTINAITIGEEISRNSFSLSPSGFEGKGRHFAIVGLPKSIEAEAVIIKTDAGEWSLWIHGADPHLFRKTGNPPSPPIYPSKEEALAALKDRLKALFID